MKGATNAALTALRILAIEDQGLAAALADFAEEQGKSLRSLRMSSSKTIGIIGGGQLGQMMAISAISWGIRSSRWILRRTAQPLAWQRLSAPYNDVDALRQLAERCDVLTYEFENVDADGLDAVIKDGQLPQGTDLLAFRKIGFFERTSLKQGPSHRCTLQGRDF